jgi:hypothetical protein
MEKIFFSENSINFQRTTRRFIPEDSEKNLSRYFGGFTRLEILECEKMFFGMPSVCIHVCIQYVYTCMYVCMYVCMYGCTLR